jgi:hypothetical protein
MYSLVYVSSATKPWTKDELVEFLSAARERNAPQGITGLLFKEEM